MHFQGTNLRYDKGEIQFIKALMEHVYLQQGLLKCLTETVLFPV